MPTIISPPRRRLARAAIAGFAAVMALGGVAHVPWVQRELGWRRDGAGVCPFGYGRQAAADAARPRTVDPWLPVATARPALAFQLDRTTRADITRWAQSHALDCQTRHGATIECLRVPARWAGGPGDVDASAMWFQLAADDSLQEIRTVRRSPTAAPIAAAYRATEAVLTREAGAPSSNEGTVDDHALERGAFRRAEIAYRFTSYRAVVNATNLGDGFVLTERYASMR